MLYKEVRYSSVLLTTCSPSDHLHALQLSYFIIHSSCIKHSRQCLTTLLNTLKFVKNTLVRLVFSTLVSVFGKVVKHGLSCLIYCMKYPIIVWVTERKINQSVFLQQIQSLNKTSSSFIYTEQNNLNCLTIPRETRCR